MPGISPPLTTQRRQFHELGHHYDVAALKKNVLFQIEPLPHITVPERKSLLLPHYTAYMTRLNTLMSFSAAKGVKPPARLKAWRTSV